MQVKKQKLWVGIDVGMKSFHAALDFPILFEGQTEIAVADLPDREFKMTSAGVKSFLSWIQLQQSDFFAKYSDVEQDDLPVYFLMEATGVCSSQLEKMLLSAMPDSTIIVHNPMPIKAYRTALNIKNKTDKSDAQVIARFGSERRPEPKIKIPEVYVRLKALVRTRSFLKDQRTAIENHHDCIESSLSKRMCSGVIKTINKELDGLDREIEKIVQNTPEIKHEVDILTSMPGVGMGTAVALLGELGSLKNYSARTKITAMTGLNPVKKQSGSSVNSARLSKKGSPVVRRFLYMASTTAVSRIQILQDLYDRILSKGNTRLQARCAVMRKMLLILRGMVVADKHFDENFKKN